MEAWDGIEPTNEDFADPCLTTWLPRLKPRLTLLFRPPPVNSLFEFPRENEKFDFFMGKWQDCPVPHQPGNLMPSEILP